MEFKLINIFKMVLQNVKKIFYISIFTFICSSLYVLFLVESEFESQSKFIVVSNSGAGSKTSNIANIASGFGISLPVDGTNTIISEDIYPTLILSENLLTNILYKSFMDYKSNSERKLIEILIKDNNKFESDFETKKNAIEILQKEKIKVSKDPRTGMIILTIISNHKLLSKDISTAILSELDVLQQNISTRNAKDKRLFIEERIVDIEFSLSNIESELIDFYNSHKQFQSSPLLLVEEQRLKTQLDVSRDVYINLKQQYETAKIEEVNQRSFIELIDGPSVALYRSSPKRKIFVLTWTLIITLISSFAFLIKESRKLLKDSDLEELNELKSIVKRQF